MRRTLSDGEAMGIGVGCLAAILVAGLLGAIRTDLDQANAALVLVLVVVLAAFTGGRWAGGATGITAAVSFDFFLTRPYGSLAIKSVDDVVTTALLLVVGIAVGTIASDRREARAAGRAGAAEVAGLYRVAGLSADAAPAEEVVAAVEQEVADVLRLRSCRFRPDAPDPSVPELEPSGRIATPYVFEGEGFALPPEGVAVAVRHAGTTIGWLVGEPVEGVNGIGRDRRRTALVLAHELALALAAGAGAGRPA